MRLLLINPKLPDSFWSLGWAIHTILPGKRAVNPPLGLATVAALCPHGWQVEIVDENIEAIPLNPAADIIGIGGMGVQAPRQRELLAYYRQRGHHVVAGGAAASLCPETYEGVADTIVAGEAEYIWPEFCRDFAAGRPQALYRETGTVEMADSPVPRFDLLKLPRYGNATLQYSRGCPFACEFCDIIVMFGRTPRTKSPEQIGRELDALRERGARSVFFVDDNMIGNKSRAKALLRFLAAYQHRHGHAFSFGTEVSLNAAQDDELLGLFQAAHFGWVFIGIESPDAASLKETGKTQNLREDILVSVRRIYARGIDVLAGFIIGFDNDTPQTFDAQFRFITEAGIQSAMIGLLSALPRTPLYARMEREGRLREIDEESDNTSLRTNIIPKTMSDEEVAHLYRDIYRRLLTDAGIGTRIRNKTRFLGPVGYGGGYTFGQSTGIVARLLFRGIIPGGPRRMYHFLRSLPFRRPSLLPLAISDWIIGLSMRAFARDHLWSALPASTPELHLLDSVRAAIARQLSQDEVWVTREATASPNLTIHLGDALKRRFFKAAAPHLCRLLEQSPARVTLAAEGMPPQYLGQFERLLARLARYGDRVSLVLSENLGRRMTLDLSIFDLVLTPAAEPAP
ncbi:B12-binding domain-containing radical SAM protein [Oleispirillum naphthae]|uniref:B12-binding domain-containing radical SAM protein n=1 Tax=Oleispirillum naphthae TaxID=2838853 RepID=UPI00308267E2